MRGVPPARRALMLIALTGTVASGCMDRPGARRLADAIVPGPVQPDELPTMLNAEPPFRYPATLWAQRVQGNVTLRVYIDASGFPVLDSTVVLEPSGIAELDSAAVRGVPLLRFRPAVLRNAPVGIALTLPVFFRHPDAPPLPGDSILPRIRRDQLVP